MIYRNEVKPPSPHDRLLIAFHSPCGVFETGPPKCPPEKLATKPVDNRNHDTFSGPVSKQQWQNCAHFWQFSKKSKRISLHGRLYGGAEEIRTLGTGFSLGNDLGVCLNLCVLSSGHEVF
jgi:hypothetical protein